MNDFELNEAARALMDTGRYTKALYLLNKIKTPELLYKKYINTALCYSEFKEYKKAIELNKKAIQSGAPLDIVYSNLGNIYSCLNKDDKALECYLKGCEQKKDEDIVPMLLYNLASHYYYNMKQYDKALEYILKINKEKAIKEKGNFNSHYKNLLARIYFKLKDYKNALIQYEENKADISPEKYFKMLICCFCLKQYKKFFTSYFDLYVNNEEYIRRKITQELDRLFDGNKYKKAVLLLNKTVKQTDVSFQYCCRAYCYMNLKRYKLAIKYAKKTIETEPDSSDGYDVLADVYFELGNYDETVRICREGCMKSLYDPVIMFNLACVYIEIKEYDKALKVLFQIYEDELTDEEIPNALNAYYQKIETIFKFKNGYDRAIEYYKKSPDFYLKFLQDIKNNTENKKNRQG